MLPYLVGLGLAVFDMLVVVEVFDIGFDAFEFVVVVVVVVVVDELLLPIVEVLLIVDVLFAIVEVLVLLALVLLVFSLPPQAAPSAPIARTAESAITFFIT